MSFRFISGPSIADSSLWFSRPRYGLLILVFSITATLSYWLLVDNSATKLKQLIADKQTLTAEYAQKLQQINTLPKLMAQIAAREKAFNTLLMQFFTPYKPHEFIDSLTTIGKETGINLLKLQWQQEQQYDFYQEIPFLLEIKASYYQLAAFAAAITRLPHLVAIKHLSIEKTNKQTSLLLVKITAVIFYPVDTIPTEK